MPEIKDGEIILKNDGEKMKMSFEKDVFDISVNRVSYTSHDDHTKKTVHTVDLTFKKNCKIMKARFVFE